MRQPSTSVSLHGIGELADSRLLRCALPISRRSSSASLPSVLRPNLPKLPYAHRNRAANRVPYPTTLLLPARRPKAAALPSRRELGKAPRCDTCDFSGSPCPFSANCNILSAKAWLPPVPSMRWLWRRSSHGSPYSTRTARATVHRLNPHSRLVKIC